MHLKNNVYAGFSSLPDGDKRLTSHGCIKIFIEKPNCFCIGQDTPPGGLFLRQGGFAPGCKRIINGYCQFILRNIKK